MLVRLHAEQASDRVIIPYVGVSKLSCHLCDLFFSAYRAATETSIRTQGCRSEMAPWSTPTLPADDAILLNVKNVLRRKLLDRLKREAKELESALRRDSLASQSTDASNDKVESDDARLDSELRFLFRLCSCAELTRGTSNSVIMAEVEELEATGEGVDPP